MPFRAFVLALVCLVPAAAAARKPAERYYIELSAPQVAEGVPQALGEQARKALAELVANRPEFVTQLEGAPDPADAAAFRKWAQKKKIRAFKVTLKLNEFRREVAPAKEGKSGQVLTVHVSVSLLGAGLVDDTIALSGDGAATIGLEVGKTVRPRDDEVAAEDSLRGALGSALDEAVQKLTTQKLNKPPGAAKKKKP